MRSLRYAYIWLPGLMLLKDITATVIVLSNEPGITAANVRHYQIGLLPGSLLFGGSGSTWIFNLLFGAAVGFAVSRYARKRRSMTGSLTIDKSPYHK